MDLGSKGHTSDRVGFGFGFDDFVKVGFGFGFGFKLF